FNSQFSGYYQSGKDRQGLKMKAFLLSASLGYKVNSNWQIGIGSDFLSGNDTDKSLKENRAFNPYFHTGHKFYGAMDYYHVGYSHGNVGLSDNYLNVHYKHGNGYSIGLTFHQFFTPNKVGKENHGYPKNMGQEADLSFGYTGIATLIWRLFYAAIGCKLINSFSISFGVKYPNEECLLSLL